MLHSVACRPSHRRSTHACRYSTLAAPQPNMLEHKQADTSSLTEHRNHYYQWYTLYLLPRKQAVRMMTRGRVILLRASTGMRSIHACTPCCTGAADTPGSTNRLLERAHPAGKARHELGAHGHSVDPVQPPRWLRGVRDAIRDGIHCVSGKQSASPCIATRPPGRRGRRGGLDRGPFDDWHIARCAPVQECMSKPSLT